MAKEAFRMQLGGLRAERGLSSPAWVYDLDQVASERPFCSRGFVTVALRETPKCGRVRFGENITV